MAKSLIDYKDRIGTIAALIGIGTVLLYVFGYVSEVYHGMIVGFKILPKNHILFLYKGGKICMVGLTFFSFFPYRMIYSFDIKYVIVLLSILTMLGGLLLRKIPANGPKFLKLRHSFGLLYVSFFLLLVNLILLLVTEPPIIDNILFQEDVLINNKALDEYIHYYIYIVGWFFVFFLICRKVWAENVKKMKGSKEINKQSGKIGTNKKSLSLRFIQVVKNLSAVTFIIMFLYYPIFIGLNRGIGEYHMVQLVLKNDSDNLRNHIPDSTTVFALLNVTDDYYVLYKRSPKPHILKIKKTLVSAVLVYKKADITKPESYNIKKARSGLQK